MSDSLVTDHQSALWISVCVAVGPTEDFKSFQKTFDSVVCQTDGSVELVVKTVGNQLVEDIQQLARCTPDLKLSLHTGEDRGIYDAFNICMRAARGNYVIFLGCGDVLADRDAAADAIRHSKLSGQPDVIYGAVLLAVAGESAIRPFCNDCFLGHRARLPWRNPCHSQGLIYKRSWLEAHPFRIDIGPLADLVHTHQHRLIDRASWLNRPVSVFEMGGMSNRLDVRAFRSRLQGVIVNCENFHFSSAWKFISSIVFTIRFVIYKMNASRLFRNARNAASN